MTDSSSLVKLQSEYESLLKDIMFLRDRVAKLTALRDDLIYHICPSLQSEYEEKIACLERELLAVQLYLREKQRIVEILQAQLNQAQKPSFTEAEQTAQEEYQEYQEELKRKAKRAKDFQDRWRKESNWYEYDKEDRSRRESNGETSDGQEESDSNKSHKKSENYKEDSQERIEEDRFEGAGKKSKASELKQLYRKIVKLLHPDVHPNPTPKEKELLNRAIEAYDKGDLETIQKIWDELTGSGLVEEETFEDNPTDIAKMKDILKKLRKRCAELEDEINQIRSSYPYTMKAFLDDEDAVKSRQDELHAEIDRIREMDRQLGEYIDKLKKQMGHA